MVSFLKRFFSLFFLFAFLCLIVKGWYFLQKGFRITKVAPTYSVLSGWEEEEDFFQKKTEGVYYLSEELSLEDLYKLFEEGFTFLGKGQQCFVFLSKDKQYALKFIRLDKFQQKPWFYTRLSWGKALAQKRKKALEKIKESLLLVREEMVEEQEVACIHFGKTHNFPTQTFLIDSLGREKRIFLNNTYFVLQKKAELLADILPKASKEQIREISVALLDAVIQRAQKKIRNKNRHSLHNMGFFKGKALEIDLAEFFKRPQADASFLYKETSKSLREYETFLQENHPEEYQFFQDRLRRIK